MSPERIAYYLGSVAADISLFVVLPNSASYVLKTSQRLSEFATKHRLVLKTREAMLNNLFDCLPYIDY